MDKSWKWWVQCNFWWHDYSYIILHIIIQKESCSDETDDVNTAYDDVVACTEFNEKMSSNYDDVMVFTNTQVDATYYDIIPCTKEKVNPDHKDVTTLAKKEVNVEYDIIIVSDSEDSSKCRPDSQVNCSYINLLAIFSNLYKPAYK